MEITSFFYDIRVYNIYNITYFKLYLNIFIYILENKNNSTIISNYLIL